MKIAQYLSPVSPGRLCAGLLAAYCLSMPLFWSDSSANSGLNYPVDDPLAVSEPTTIFGSSTQPVLLAQASGNSEGNSNWDSSRPPTDQFDWIQTTSGEWLKGELNYLYSGKLEFDSDEFGIQTLDIDDVQLLLSHGSKRISVDLPSGLEILDGVLNIDGEKVSIATDGDTREFDRSALVSITPNAESEEDNWSAKISFGLNFTRGNSEQTDFTAKVNVNRRTPENRFVLDYLGNYSKSRDTETINNHRLSSFFDIFAAREYFWRPIFGEYYRDPFQNIDDRLTIGVGAGYHIIDTPKTSWDISGGPAYRVTRYSSVEAGEDDRVDTPALILGTFYDTTLTRTVDFNAGYNFSIVNKESGTYTHHAIATIETEITSILDFDISLIWDRTQDPQATAGGEVPDQDDFQLLLTLGVDI